MIPYGIIRYHIGDEHYSSSHVGNSGARAGGARARARARARAAAWHLALTVKGDCDGDTEGDCDGAPVGDNDGAADGD